MLLKPIILILFLVSVSLTGIAQRVRKSKPLPAPTEGYLSLSIQLNAWRYAGDVAANFSFIRPGMSVFLMRKLSPHWQARLQLAVGRLEGDDASAPSTSGGYARNFHFRNDIKELSTLLVYEFKSSYGKYAKRAKFTPYCLFGFGITHHNPKAKSPEKFNNTWVDLQALGTEGQGRIGYAKPYSKVVPVIPIGLGLRWRTSDKRWDFSVEIVPRYTFTDYLDDVSSEYPEMADLANPLAVAFSNRSLETTSARNNQARQMENVFANFGKPITYIGTDGQNYSTIADFQRGRDKRGNPNSKDFYLTVGFHLSYIMNVGLKCPQMRW